VDDAVYRQQVLLHAERRGYQLPAQRARSVHAFGYWKGMRTTPRIQN
jgi:hypothetical protein